jgi:iron complex transport system ATP-binding protein
MEGEMSDYYLNTKNLTVGYKGVPLIENIDMRLNKGEILTLIGPNGSGKSTILKTITKHLKKIGGTVYIDNKNMEDLSYKEVSTRLAVVLTERLKTEMMTCWDLVATGRYPYTNTMGIYSDHDKEQVKNAMERVDAYGLKDRSFEAISDGQRQRILLARAICQEPDIIVLDEPTSFLDVKHKLELLSILKKMAKEDNITVVMSLHEIDLAQKISDKIMCVKGETIQNYGTPGEIFSQQLVQELYDIKKGSYNVLFGSVELTKPTGEPKVFVVAGGGTGIKHYRELQRKEIPFYAGVLHENDIDCQVAQSIAHKVFAEKSFSRISENRIKEALSVLNNCHYLLYSGVEFGEMNDGNRQLLEKAKLLRIPIVNAVDELF